MEDGVLTAAHKVGGYIGITRLAADTTEEEREEKGFSRVHAGHQFSFSKGADTQLSQQRTWRWGAGMGLLKHTPCGRAFPWHF